MQNGKTISGNVVLQDKTNVQWVVFSAANTGVQVTFENVTCDYVVSEQQLATEIAASMQQAGFSAAAIAQLHYAGSEYFEDVNSVEASYCSVADVILLQKEFAAISGK